MTRRWLVIFKPLSAQSRSSCEVMSPGSWNAIPSKYSRKGAPRLMPSDTSPQYQRSLIQAPEGANYNFLRRPRVPNPICLANLLRCLA